MKASWLLSFGLVLSAATLEGRARAQVADSERAAARELFKQGDELQRAGKFADALDRFKRAEQVIHAPTNVLRVAECEAALGRLVEAAESYRGVVRWALPPGSPPAFQSAIDQARGELAQVEPRVPRVVVQVTPPALSGAQLVVDGTPMSGALLGEPLPLDPGAHKIAATAPGYASSVEAVTLRERETRTVALVLKATPVDAPPSAEAATPAAAPPAQEASAVGGDEHPAPRRESGPSLLMGVHLGLDVMTGSIPLNSANGEASASDVSGPGLAFGLDGGLRFLRQWYIGLTLEHAQFATGKNPSQLGPASTTGDLTSSTSSLGLVGAFVLNPDRPTLYAELGLDLRSYQFSTTATGTQTYPSAELLAGVGLWLPLGRWFRLLPIATIGAGSFSPPGTQSGNSAGEVGHTFVMLGVAGFYDLPL